MPVAPTEVCPRGIRSRRLRGLGRRRLRRPGRPRHDSKAVDEPARRPRRLDSRHRDDRFDTLLQRLAAAVAVEIGGGVTRVDRPRLTAQLQIIVSKGAPDESTPAYLPGGPPLSSRGGGSQLTHPTGLVLHSRDGCWGRSCSSWRGVGVAHARRRDSELAVGGAFGGDRGRRRTAR